MQHLATRLGTFRSAPASLFLALAAAATLQPALAATPSSGTLSDVSGPITFTSGPFTSSNPTPVPAVDSGPRCNSTGNPCDSYELTVVLPAGYAVANPNDKVKITASWAPAGTDVDVWIYEGVQGDTNGGQAGFKNAATSANPEIAILPLTDDLSKVYTIKVVPFAASGATVTTVIELVAGDAPPPPPPAGGAGRHTTLASPPTLGNSAGEPSIGYNLRSKRTMYLAGLETLKVTFPEYSDIKDAAGDALPLSCDATWQEVSFPSTSTTSLDPILFTNQSLGESVSGRTFVSQLTGANSLYAYTDDDGANWIPAQQGPPNGGVDHQTTGAGPYPPASSTFPGAPPGNPGYAVYYCSQSVADAFCARSDTGGQTFGPGVAVGKPTTLGCAAGDLGALHGHVRISAGGDLAIPFKSCGGNQGFLMSTDAGNTYSAKKVPNTTPGDTDPQLAWSNPDAQGKSTGYLCFVDGDGKPKVSVTLDKGTTWATPYDLGAQHNIKNAVFAQGIAGDPDRAACAFVGTTTQGNYGAGDFVGIWYGYVAYTYDGGQNWTTINVTPNDPVQGEGGICTSGIGCTGNNRNLLDFNEMAVDEKGRVLFGYADGCITAACITSGGGNNDFSDKAMIARQIGGRSLFASFDAQVPTVPQGACLSGTRNPSKSALTWKTPDDAGKTITGYNVYRSTNVAGPFVKLATTQVKNSFDDLTADSEVPEYFYRIAATYDEGAGGGEGLFSNLLLLPITVGESVCTPPGLTQLTDAAGDATDQVPAHDVRSMSISQPYFADGSYKLFFHLRMASLATMPEDTQWPVNFCGPAFPCINPDVNTAAYGANNKWYTVHMSTVPPATSVDPVFELFVPTATGTTATGRTRITLPEGADGSNFTASGLITMVVNASDIGLTTAGAGTEKLSKFQTRIRAQLPTGGAVTPDNMPDGLAGIGEYTTTPLGFCAPNIAPLARLAASAQSGRAPLTVAFDASDSSDDDGSVANYSLDFGDGTAPIAQDTPFFTHAYQAGGVFAARLFVTDNRGLRSSNTAQKVIEVIAARAEEGPEAPGNNRVGGAFSIVTLAVIGLLGLICTRRRYVRS